MKYVQILFVAILLYATSASGSCPLDGEKLLKSLLDGDRAGARQMISEMAFNPECECTSREVACIRLGPEGSDTLSINQFMTGLDGLDRFEDEMSKACGKLPEKDQKDWDTKLSCFGNQLEEYQKQVPGNSQSFFKDLAEKIVSKHSESVKSKINAKKEAKIKVENESLQYRNRDRLEKIAKEICELHKERKIQSARLKNVARHSGGDRNAQQKLVKIEYLVKNLDDRIEKLKMEFQSVEDKSFYLSDWCKDEKR